MSSSILPAPVQSLYRGATGVSTCFGTFGELLQGVLPGPDGHFLVTLPVARWTMATFQLDPGVADVEVRPAHKRKALRLAETILAQAGAASGGVLTIDSNLPEGKGMASSSADLVATARAMANALQLDMTPHRIERLLRDIEPTDGVLYPAVVAFDHRNVRLRSLLGSLPAMTIIGLDEGGTVDTVAFNRIAKPFSAADRAEYARLLDRMAVAVASRDLAGVGAVATRSAVMNQALWPKRTLPAVLDICAEVGALGVVAAHSGTMLGLLLDTADPAYQAKTAAAVRACAALGGDVSLYRSLSFD
ncbi:MULTISPECIES: GHMP family kinase ATP-binding protein [Dactylosporangium]|uniref:Kinase n=2 Tax=Dactylosporangium TaxID=35753 RepID=A0A9W6NPP5_9ACTN|nr:MULTISPECIES: kinase [Dactylosporangium]UAB93887.1 kinase [Dactylosporangium vinaceum]UWZ42307.1 kinase [Dactylosporangium matsuzakiense]GLL05320.1 kinase [Dactylosporangium matsuzakiense]